MQLDTPNISGVSHSSQEWGECILINTAMHQHRRAFDLLHEYGHVLVDSVPGWRAFGNSLIDDDLIERRADAFAAAFLMPDDGVTSFLETRGVRPGEAQFLDIFFVMLAFGSSYQATLYRMQELNILSDHQVQAYLTARNITEMMARVRSSQGLRMVDQGHPTRRRFGQLVMRAYSRGKISLGRVGELLDLDPVEVRELAVLWQVNEASELPRLAG
jgi:Zn-dependent peptidase ImmA (M78 family)